MKIGLIDVDGHNYPNLPLMKISACHKLQGDIVEWYQPLLSGHVDIVYMSKVFSFTPDYEYYIDADKIIKGGSGYCIELINGYEKYNLKKDVILPYEIEHIYPDYSIYPQFTKDTAYGFLTRGCPRGCAFCHVAVKEGNCSHKVADLHEFWDGQKNIILNDPNILACKDKFLLLNQLVESKAIIEFNQGIDARLITPKIITILQSMKLSKMHFAFDRIEDADIIIPKLHLIAEAGYNRSKGGVTIYILCNYNTTLSEDIERIQLCRSLNFSPYPMIYDKAHADPVYKKLQRWCNNFIFWKCETFDDYLRGVKHE